MLLQPFKDPEDTAAAEATPLPAGLLPLIDRADHRAPSVFRPENMMREARRQKGLSTGPVPRVVLLDPDGDMV